MNKGWLGCLALCCLLSCVEYTPKPKGYLRIEPAAPQYTLLTETELPFEFAVSRLATVELPPEGQATWINIAYQELRVKIYCSYLSVTPQTFSQIDDESRSLLYRQIKQAEVSEKAFTHSEVNVYAAFFEVAGEAPSPIQFIVTDSVSHFFRGALYYENYGDADSLAPVTNYLRADIIELIQTFNWKN